MFWGPGRISLSLAPILFRQRTTVPHSSSLPLAFNWCWECSPPSGAGARHHSFLFEGVPWSSSLSFASSLLDLQGSLEAATPLPVTSSSQGAQRAAAAGVGRVWLATFSLGLSFEMRLGRASGLRPGKLKEWVPPSLLQCVGMVRGLFRL